MKVKCLYETGLRYRGTGQYQVKSQDSIMSVKYWANGNSMRGKRSLWYTMVYIYNLKDPRT